MSIYDNSLYNEDIDYVADLSIPWDMLRNKSVLISGATGLIGSFLVDVLMRKNELTDLNCTVYALSRNRKKASERFSRYNENRKLVIVPFDIKQHLELESVSEIDYVLHLASNTHPVQYSTDPIGTITTNILGLINMLDFARLHGAKRFAFASSNEIYGENRGDVELFDETYCGYIDSNTMRAGYPESKRCGESLCQAYISQYGMDIVIPRLTRTYGPTMLLSDTKAMSQFIKKAVAGEDIVLKSEGTQYYSYQYVADSVSGLLTVLFCGENGQAYNIADIRSDIMLKDLASMIAETAGKQVIFEIPDKVEALGYSKATKSRLDGSKLQRLGWTSKYGISQGIERTVSILKEAYHGAGQ